MCNKQHFRLTSLESLAKGVAYKKIACNPSSTTSRNNVSEGESNSINQLVHNDTCQNNNNYKKNHFKAAWTQEAFKVLVIRVPGVACFLN